MVVLWPEGGRGDEPRETEQGKHQTNNHDKPGLSIVRRVVFEKSKSEVWGKGNNEVEELKKTGGEGKEKNVGDQGTRSDSPNRNWGNIFSRDKSQGH